MTMNSLCSLNGRIQTNVCHIEFQIEIRLVLVVFVLKKISLKQNKSHSRSLDLHIVYVNEDLPE